MTEQEAQQAQTIAEIRELNELAQALGNDIPATLRCVKLLEIVDSQAQKIAEQAREITQYNQALAQAQAPDTLPPKKLDESDTESLHGIPFNADIRAACYGVADMWAKHGEKAANLLEYWIERCRRSENKAVEQAHEIARLKATHKIPCTYCDSTGEFCIEETGEIIKCDRCGGSGYHLLTAEQTTDSKGVAR